MKKMIALSGLAAAIAFSANVMAAEVNAIDIDTVTKIVETKSVQPNFPEMSMRANSEGAVVLKYDIDKRGRPKDVELVSSTGSKLFLREAVKALKSTRFEPVVINGEVVRVNGMMRKYNYTMVDERGNRVVAKR